MVVFDKTYCDCFLLLFMMLTLMKYTSFLHVIFIGILTAETFLEAYITQSLLPLVLPINQESLKLLKDDKRKVVLTIVNNELDDKSKDLFKLLKAAASANRDLVFGYVGFQQFEVFVESFDVNKKTQFPKMVVWNGDEEYFSVSYTSFSTVIFFEITILIRLAISCMLSH